MESEQTNLENAVNSFQQLTPEQQKEFFKKTLIKGATIELESLTKSEKELLAGGYECRGMDCVIQRWYLPDNLKSGFMGNFREISLEIENEVRTIHGEYMDSQDEEEGY